jgi:hypothetical protein
VTFKGKLFGVFEGNPEPNWTASKAIGPEDVFLSRTYRSHNSEFDFLCSILVLAKNRIEAIRID